MINRIAGLVAEKDRSTSRQKGRSLSWANPDWKQVLAQIEQTIAKNPAATLVGAFALGVAIAWWIKRK